MEYEAALDNQIPVEKIYKDKEVWVGTFLGGPVVAGYMIARNFKALGENSKVLKTWAVTLVATVFIFGIAFFAPYAERVPNFLFTLVYTGIAFLLMQIYQGEKIKTFLRAGGRIHSWWKTLGVTFIGMIITIIPLIGVTLLIESAALANIATKSYGSMQHEITFDKSNLTESEIDAIAESFSKARYFDDETQKFIYAKKVDDTYEFSFSFDKSISSDSQTAEFYGELRNWMQPLFPDNKIVFNLVAGDLDNVVKRLE
jgi:hypothetical protein